MRLPPLQTFDIETLNPTFHEVTLSLPSISAEEVSQAFRGFSEKLTEVCGETAHSNPTLFTDLLCRSILLVASKILTEPDLVFETLRMPEYEPWSRRRITLLAPSAEQAVRNQSATLITLRELGAGRGDIELLFWMTSVGVMGSLANIGRLPMQEVPAAPNGKSCLLSVKF